MRCLRTLCKVSAGASQMTAICHARIAGYYTTCTYMEEGKLLATCTVYTYHTHASTVNFANAGSSMEIMNSGYYIIYKSSTRKVK